MYHPVPMKLLAEAASTPSGAPPSMRKHAALGAVWMPAGNWRRPEYYARDGESRAQSIEAEVQAVRAAVGIIDVGTLGKIEVHGPQAGEFLERVYACRYSDLKVGMSRYGLMLMRPAIIDDGGDRTPRRVDDDRSSLPPPAGPRRFRELLRLNALWGLDRAGERHRPSRRLQLCRSLVPEPPRPAADTTVRCRSSRFSACARAAFAGVAGAAAAGRVRGRARRPDPRGRGRRQAAVWQGAATRPGRPRGLRPFGVEAQRVLRLEKGYFIVGQDTDGLTDPYEANAAPPAVKFDEPLLVRQRSLKI